MNYQRLNELAAKAMGWTLIGWGKCEPSAPFYQNEDGESTFSTSTWNPSTCADDALVLLEKVAQGKGYSIYMFPEEKKPYNVELEVFKYCTGEKTLPVAMTVAALRASGIPEYEIQEALK